MADFTEEQLLEYNETTVRFLRTDADFLRLTAALRDSWRIYGLARDALARFTSSEGLAEAYPDYVLECVQYQAKKPFDLVELQRNTENSLAAFVREEVSFHKSRVATEQKRQAHQQANNDIVLSLSTGESLLVRPATVQLLVGPSERVHSELQHLLAGPQLQLASPTAEPFSAERLVRLVHFVCESGAAFDARSDSWLQAGRSAQTLRAFLRQLQRITGKKRNVFVFSNLHLLVAGLEARAAKHNRRCVGTVQLLAKTAALKNCIYVLGVYQSGGQADADLAQALQGLHGPAISVHTLPAVEDESDAA